MKHLRPQLPADWRTQTENVMADESHQAREKVTTYDVIDGKWNVTGFLSRDPGLVGSSDLEANIGPRVSSTNDENCSALKLGGVSIVVRMQLDNAGGKIVREVG